MLGTRLLPTALFENAADRANLSQAIRDVLPFANPYIVVGTPLLFAYTEGTTSVTPAWRTSLWHVSPAHISTETAENIARAQARVVCFASLVYFAMIFSEIYVADTTCTEHCANEIS